MEILNWKILKEDEYWVIKLFTRDFGWVDEKERFIKFKDAAKYLEESYGKTKTE